MDKVVGSIFEALSDVNDGMSILVGGFGGAGLPEALLGGILLTTIRDLTIYSNNAGFAYDGIARLIDAGRVRKVVCSFPRSADPRAIDRAWREGEVEIEVVPQGTLAERIRCGGAGIPAFYTPTSAGIEFGQSKESREFEGREYVLEYAIHADFAFIHAEYGDKWGNLVYRKTARNFNPVMATAARCCIAEVNEIANLGELDPELVGTSGIFVDRMVKI